jgi:hypothetical protein
MKGVFAEKPLKGSALMVDQTAVGRGVYDLFWNGRTGATVWGLAVTAGHSAGKDDHGGNLIPKKDLVGVLQVLLQGKRLQVAKGLEMAGALAEELQQFRLKTVPLTDDVVEWRERPHDDLVLAVAVAVLQVERPGGVFAYTTRTMPPQGPRAGWPVLRPPGADGGADAAR